MIVCFRVIGDKAVTIGCLCPDGTENAWMMPAVTSIAPRNGILRCLAFDEMERLRPYLSRVQLVSGQVLFERSSLIEHAYFVESGMISLVSGTEENQLGVEVGIVGR